MSIINTVIFNFIIKLSIMEKQENWTNKDIQSERYKNFVVGILRRFITIDEWETKGYKKLTEEPSNMNIWRQAMITPLYSLSSKENNDILEFIGDASLKFAFPWYIIKLYPNKQSAFHANMNSYYMGETSHLLIAQKLGINEWLQSLVRPTKKVIKDAFEAFVGALEKTGSTIRHNLGNILVKRFVVYIFEHVTPLNENVGLGVDKSKLINFMKNFVESGSQMPNIEFEYEGHDIIGGYIHIPRSMRDEFKEIGIELKREYTSIGTDKKTVEGEIFAELIPHIDTYLQSHNVDEIKMNNLLLMVSKRDEKLIRDELRDRGYNYMIFKSQQKSRGGDGGSKPSVSNVGSLIGVKNVTSIEEGRHIQRKQEDILHTYTDIKRTTRDDNDLKKDTLIDFIDKIILKKDVVVLLSPKKEKPVILVPPNKEEEEPQRGRKTLGTSLLPSVGFSESKVVTPLTTIPQISTTTRQAPVPRRSILVKRKTPSPEKKQEGEIVTSSRRRGGIVPTRRTIKETDVSTLTPSTEIIEEDKPKRKSTVVVEGKKKRTRTKEKKISPSKTSLKKTE